MMHFIIFKKLLHEKYPTTHKEYKLKNRKKNKRILILKQVLFGK
jgi:hypothetical protein